MNQILLIIKRELRAFFNTWMGYLIAAATLFINGLLFHSFALGSTADYSANILYRFFYMSSGIAMVAGLLLAMRLIAEEKQTGTLTLYFTSPISSQALIYGKFLSTVLFFLVLQVLTLYLPAIIFWLGKISIGHLLVGYLGTTLLGMTVIAISLFASVIAPNQLLAAFFATLFTVGLLTLWMLSSMVDNPFRDLFSYLAIHNDHFTPFGKGILHLKHVVFYLSVMIFFLECGVRTLEARRVEG